MSRRRLPATFAPISEPSRLRDDFARRGFSDPHRFLDPETAADYRNRFYASIGQDPERPGPCEANLDGYHARFRWAYELATHPTLLETVSAVLGSDDLVLWAMHFWYKAPRSGTYVPWHQDANYWPIEPRLNATAWIALGPTFRANGCLRLIPGTHREDFGHRDVEGGDALLAQEVDPAAIDAAAAVDCEMQPGEFVCFNERALHGSEANTSDVARVACSVRYTTPAVRFGFDPGDPRIKIMLVRGEDRHRLNPSFACPIPA